MRKKLLCIAVACIMLCNPLNPLVAKAMDMTRHTCDLTDTTYGYTEETGTYGHYYVVSMNPYTGETEYDTCLVICETEYYLYQCSFDGCYKTGSVAYTLSYDCHSNCGQGDVPAN